MIQETLDAINALPSFDWEAHDLWLPRPNSMEAATEFTKSAHETITANGMAWKSPAVGVGESGSVSFQWWQDSRSVTLYFDVEELWWCSYDTQQDPGRQGDGIIGSSSDLLDMWKWLAGDAK